MDEEIRDNMDLSRPEEAPETEPAGAAEEAQAESYAEEVPGTEPAADAPAEAQIENPAEEVPETESPDAAEEAPSGDISKEIKETSEQNDAADQPEGDGEDTDQGKVSEEAAGQNQEDADVQNPEDAQDSFEAAEEPAAVGEDAERAEPNAETAGEAAAVKKREFSSLSAAAGKIMAAVDDAGNEAASAAQDAEVSAAERAAANEEQARLAKAAGELAKDDDPFSAESAADEPGWESPWKEAVEAPVDYSVAKGASIDIYGDRDQDQPAWSADEAYSDSSRENPSADQAENNDRISGSYSSIYSDTEGGGTYNPIPDEPSEKKGSSGLLKKILAGVLALLLCFAGGYAGSVIGNKVSNVADDSAGAGTPGSVSISGDVDSLNAASVIAEKTMPSVVGISTVSQTLTETIFGLQSGQSMGIGTGLIVSEDGYILTNSHVVNDGDAETITVDLYDGTEYEGSILWNDASLDLAIVKIDASGLTPAELGDSDTVRIGDYALAIGNPLGLDFERSVTSGIISGLNRSITVAASVSATTGNTMDGLIQTDASINSGNSGGPLINSAGQVIGINSAKASSAEGLGFAIPINVAIPIIQQIMETGTFESAYIGVSGYDLAAVVSSLDADFNTQTGVYINEIFSGSGADNAGLQAGDVIVAVEGKDVDGMSSLKKLLINYRPGDTVAVTVERNKEEMTVDVVLGSASELTETVPSEQNGNAGNDQNGEGQEGNEGQGPEQPQDGNNGFGYGPGGLGDLFNDFFGN